MHLSSGPVTRPYRNPVAPERLSRQSRINQGRDQLQLSFAGSKPETNSPNLLKRIWQWIKDFPERLSNFLRKLFHIQQPPPLCLHAAS